MPDIFSTAAELMRQKQTSFYLYDEQTIVRQAATLRESMSACNILFSVKSNPFSPLLRCLAAQGFGADAASTGEVDTALNAGMPVVLYSAPGKTRAALERTLNRCVVVADSWHELAHMEDIARQRGQHYCVGLRVNPDTDMHGGSGLPSKFGVDAEQLDERADFLRRLRHVTVTGMHTHVRSQVLDAAVLREYYRTVFALTRHCVKDLELPLEFVNFGSGLGVVYDAAREHALDMAALGAEFTAIAEGFTADLNIGLYLESGRFLVSEAGWFVTRIADIKTSRGKKYYITESGINGFLRPAMPSILARYADAAGMAAGCEPFYSARNAFPCRLPLLEERPLERADVVGPLCTAADVLAENTLLPAARIGDMLMLGHAGAYGHSLSPLAFSSHAAPQQFFLTADGEILEG